jgi:protein mago nashi
MLELEVRPNGKFVYRNATSYKNEGTICKETWVSGLVLEELRSMISESGILACDDAKWPDPTTKNSEPRQKEGSRSPPLQELEIVLGNEHISFCTTQIGTAIDIANSDDPKGLMVFANIVHDLKELLLTLVRVHFVIQPIPV